MTVLSASRWQASFRRLLFNVSFGQMLSVVRIVVLPAIFCLGVIGCEYVRPTLNAPLARQDATYGYRLKNLTEMKTNTDELFIVGAFSGGGIRASAFAFGALQEMARQTITWQGMNKRLLDELDIISAVSGGAYTAGYYALYGDRLFHDFEARFLRKNWEKELKSRIFWSPSNWIRLWSPYFGRANLLAELLDEALFDGHTYDTLVRRKTRPFVTFTASDMGTHSRFAFTQPQFDWICSDLSRLPIAVAAAASSALPLVLSPMSFKNYAGQCGFEPTPFEIHEQTVEQSRLAKELFSYLDRYKRPYVHVLDGSLADNIAVRNYLENVILQGGLQTTLKAQGVRAVKKFVFLVVNAETSPDPSDISSRDQVPLIVEQVRAVIDIPINRYSRDSYLLLNLAVERWREQLRLNPPDGCEPFAPEMDMYVIDVSLGALPDGEERAFLMQIPTTLSLEDYQIDRLQEVAARLMRESPEFQRLMRGLRRSPE
jgi:NTE family protein